MNQFCCQKGKSESDCLPGSLTTTRVEPVVDEIDGWAEDEDEEGFLRVRLGEPEEATVSEPEEWERETFSKLGLGLQIGKIRIGDFGRFSDFDLQIKRMFFFFFGLYDAKKNENEERAC